MLRQAPPRATVGRVSGWADVADRVRRAAQRILGVGERTIDGHLEHIKQKICETRRVRVAMRLQELGYRPPP